MVEMWGTPGVKFIVLGMVLVGVSSISLLAIGNPEPWGCCLSGFLLVGIVWGIGVLFFGLGQLTEDFALPYPHININPAHAGFYGLAGVAFILGAIVLIFTISSIVFGG